MLDLFHWFRLFEVVFCQSVHYQNIYTRPYKSGMREVHILIFKKLSLILLLKNIDYIVLPESKHLEHVTEYKTIDHIIQPRNSFRPIFQVSP